MTKYIFFIFALNMLAACSPVQDADVSLPPLPSPPAVSAEFMPNDSNHVIVRDLSSGFFDRTWEFTGGVPLQSKRLIDTIFYPKAGTYTITIYASAEGGGGTSLNTLSVKVPKDAVGQCDPQVALLTGDCGAAGKCWTFTHAAGAVRVGPNPGSSEWYSSPANGLQAAQYDDKFCFYFPGSSFIYDNNGQSVDPFNGYAVVNYTPPAGLTWFISKGAGASGEDRIVLPQGTFIGVWDSGPLYDIVSLTESKMVLRSKIVNTNGWFDLTFEKVP
jgi:hypothetical protein